jgi:predicted Fe-Mo cluster-binding NifX family protein
MKIAIPVWNGVVSSVFDFAHSLLLVDIENGRQMSRSEVSLSPESAAQRASRLKSLGTNVLICGAVSRPLMYMLTASGIDVLPYVTGPVDGILQAYMTGQLGQPQFVSPGFWPGARKGFRGWRRRRRWRGGRYL